MNPEQDAKSFVQSALKATGMTVDQLAERLDYKSLKRAMSGEIPLPESKRRHIHDLVTIAEMNTRPAPSFGDRLANYQMRVVMDDKSFATLLGITPGRLKELRADRIAPSKHLAAKFEELEQQGSHVAEDHLAEKYERLRDQKRDGNGISNRPSGDAPVAGLRKIPVIGMARAGALVEYEDVVDYDAAVSIAVRNPKAFAIVVQGDSMQPLINEGDLVVVCPGDRPVNEKYVVARLKSGGVVCKQFRRLSEQEYELRSLNPFYSPIRVLAADLVWIYPVANLIKSL